MSEWKTLTFDSGRRGIDDLNSIYAFHGGSQGDDTRSNDVELYKASNGWLILNRDFKDINYLDQNEVDKRSKEIDKENNLYIKRLKQNKKYGSKLPETNLKLKLVPLYDTPTKKISDKPLESYRMTMLDFSK